MMRRISVLSVFVLAGCGDDSSGAPPDAPPLGPGVTVHGQVVRAPGQPVPIADVTVSVINPVEDPDHLIQAKTDDHGLFFLHDVHPTSGGRVRLFIDGTTGGGGPFIVMNTEFPVDAHMGADVGTIHLVPMDPAGIVRINSDNAVIMTGPDGRAHAALLADVTVSAGSVRSDEPGAPISASRNAQLTIPQGTQLTFPYASPLLVNVTRVDLSAIPAPLPRAANGPRYSDYFVTLQPSGLELDKPVGLQLPEIDPWPDPPGPIGQALEFWEVDTSTETFNKVADGTVQHIPGIGTMAVSNNAFVRRFGWYAATPPCTAHLTQVTGRVIDAGMQPLVGATVRTSGLRAPSLNDGRFTIMNVPLGCLPTGSSAPNLEVLGSLQKNDGTFLSGSSGSKPSTPDGTTDIGDITLTTPLYVVRAQPDSASGIPVDTVFDVFFSEAIDPATLTPAATGIPSVQIQLRRVSNIKGSCSITQIPVAGMAILDSADATHVQFVPTQPLTQGETFAGFVDATVIRSASGHIMPQDFATPFSTVDTVAPDASILQPLANSALIEGSRSIIATGQADDSVGIARAKFQLFNSDANGTPGTMHSEIPAAIINNDPCAPNHSVRLRAQFDAPPVGFYILRLVVADTSGNPQSADHLIQVVQAGQAFPFCGQAMTTAFVSSNGYITFDSGDTTYDPTVQLFFSHSRVSAYYTDVDFRTQPMGNVVWNVYTGDASGQPAFVVTWIDSGMFSSLPAHNTFQIALFRNGAIQISYQNMSDILATTSGTQPEDFFMGVSCPGTPTTPAPAKTNLLTAQQQPDTTNEGRDISPWNNEAIYDFVDRSGGMTPPPPSQLFATRYFNFVPPGAPTPGIVPIMQGGNSIPSILGDDLAEAIPITFSAQTMPDAGTGVDAGVIPDAAVPPDAGVSACSQTSVSTIAGNGTPGFVDGTGGPAGPAQFNNPQAVVLDTTPTMYIADTNNHRIRRLDAQSNVSTLAGNGTPGFFDGSGGPTGTAMFQGPQGVAVNAAGTIVYVADTLNNRIRQILLGQMVVGTLAGNGQTVFADGSGGPTGTATFNAPRGIVFDPTRNAIIVADNNNNRIRQVDVAGGRTTTIAGTGAPGFLDTIPLQSQFNHPNAVAVDPNGTIFVADGLNNRIRVIAGGTVSTLAGNGSAGSFDGTGGPAGTTTFNNPRSISLGSFGGVSTLFVADATNNKIRAINAVGGSTRTVAGDGNRGFIEGGGCGAEFILPIGLVFWPGNAVIPGPQLAIGDSGNHRIRYILLPTGAAP